MFQNVTVEVNAASSDVSKPTASPAAVPVPDRDDNYSEDEEEDDMHDDIAKLVMMGMPNKRYVRDSIV